MQSGGEVKLSSVSGLNSDVFSCEGLVLTVILFAHEEGIELKQVFLSYPHLVRVQSAHDGLDLQVHFYFAVLVNNVHIVLLAVDNQILLEGKLDHHFLFF